MSAGGPGAVTSAHPDTGMTLATRDATPRPLDDGLHVRVPTPGGRVLDVRLLTRGLLRTPGFPASLLDGAGAPRALEAVDALAAADDVVERERRQFLDHVWPAVRAGVHRDEPEHARTARNRARRRVRSRAPMDGPEAAALRLPEAVAWAERWNEAIGRVRKQRAFAESSHAHALARARRHVREVFDDSRLRHAVFLSNPAFFTASLEPLLEGDDGAREGAQTPSARERRTLLTAHRYLRRVTVRCETVSFFGPVLFADFVPNDAAALTVGEPGQERVAVEASTWLVDAIAEQLTARRPVAEHVLTRSPLFSEAPGGEGLCFVMRDRVVTVPARALEVWRAADGTVTVAFVAERLGRPVEQVAEVVRTLARAFHLAAAPLPAVELFPLERLAVADPDGPAARLAALRDEFTASGWPERRRALARLQEAAGDLGLQERRNAGRHYADRELVHEDRSSPYSERVTVSGPALDGVRTTLEALLPLCYLGALLRREDARRALRRELGGSRQPLGQLAIRDIPADDELSARLAARLAALVADRRPAHRTVDDRRCPDDGSVPTVDLSRDDIDEATSDLWREAAPPGEPLPPCFPSPDLMAAGRRLEDATWVLSELHDDCSSFFGGLERTVHSDPDGLWESFVDVVVRAVDADGMATIVSRRRSAHVTPELPGLSIELSGRSRKPRSQVVPIAVAWVAADGAAIEVDGRRYALYPGDLSSFLHRALALPAVAPVPVSLGEATPRIRIDGVVYQRATWRIDLAGGRGRADTFERWSELHQLRRAHALPRRVFVRHPDEAKPLYLDFADPLAVADIGRLGAGTVTVTEMLPTPDALWWSTDGHPQCCEMRLGCCVTDGGAAEASGDGGADG